VSSDDHAALHSFDIGTSHSRSSYRQGQSQCRSGTGAVVRRGLSSDCGSGVAAFLGPAYRGDQSVVCRVLRCCAAVTARHWFTLVRSPACQHNWKHRSHPIASEAPLNPALHPSSPLPAVTRSARRCKLVLSRFVSVIDSAVPRRSIHEARDFNARSISLHPCRRIDRISLPLRN
jgi:hypothetical protein